VKLVLFDIDGTLLLSRGAGRRAVLGAMAGMLPPPEAVKGVRFDGKTDPQIVSELLRLAGDPRHADTGHITEVLDDYVRRLREELARPEHVTDVMPGVYELLDRVDAHAGTVLGLLTGNVAPGAELKLRSAAIDPARFRVGAFGSDHPERSELPAIAAARAEQLFGRRPSGADVVIVGDTPADVTCGRGIGARAIAVATGSYSTGDLMAAGAFAAFENLADLETVWEAILA
jgi:phosphoglycolate phosphatase-like HAD superfamily hydrolase